MRTPHLVLVALCAVLAAASPQVVRALSPEILALHWHPASAEAAANRTLAAAAWLERDGDDEDWSQSLDAITLSLTQRLERLGPIDLSGMDGLLAWLARQRQVNLGEGRDQFPVPAVAGIETLLRREHAAGQLARLRRVATWQAGAIWQQVAERVGEQSVRDYWQPELARLDAVNEARDEALDEADDAQRRADLLDYARSQAIRSQALVEADDAPQIARLSDALLRARAEQARHSEQWLDLIWTTFEALARLSQLDASSADLASEWAVWIDSFDAEALRALRAVDVDLPVVLAMLGDSAAYLAASERAVHAALGELGDVYARLVLFAPDLSFYLDQPVREGVLTALANCNPDPLLMGPLPRETFERCAHNLLDLLVDGLDSEEMVGGAQGPFATEFLSREMGLVSWQRAAYMDGHLAWWLDAQCRTPAWVNLLDWSLIADHLVRWVAQRPVFFAGADWRSSLDDLHARTERMADGHIEWIDCLTGQGSERRDPVLRLLDVHAQALGEVERMLGESSQRFYQEVTRPGADIDLAGSADQVTAYRPQDLTIGPCPGASTCGARAELPVSRALLGLFPNAYLLADQIGLGRFDLCYEAVRWVDRSATPARDPASQVADYHGHLSFDLVGRFIQHQQAEPVIRLRLTDPQKRHYLFEADDPEILALDCPIERVGRSIASRLPEDHTGLVPNRLTYFASAPTTAEALLLANWERGAEWRDWFLSPERVVTLEAAQPEAMQTRVQAELAALKDRRERRLSTPLINPPRAGDSDPIALTMARVADSAALLRRIMELHYPRILRQYTPIRALLRGDSGLVTRDRVRLLRDAGVPARDLSQVGLQRVAHFREIWLELPVPLRERGQRSPELDYGLERLGVLERQEFSRPAASPVGGQSESSSAP